jgi:serine/threonine-protein kinase
LYRALTGRKPFEGLDPMATLTAALVQEPPRPSSVEPSIPLGIELVVQHAMAKDPKERFQSIAELDEALEPFDQSSGPLSVAVSTPGAIDVGGRTVLSHPGSATQAPSVRGSARQARLARPGVAFFTVLGTIWVVANAVTAVAAVIRQLRGGELTASETVLIPLGTLAAAATPLALWIRYVGRQVWQSTPRAMELGARLRLAVLYSATGYGLTALFVQLFESVFQRAGADLSLPGWPLLCASVALLVGGVTWVLTQQRK